MDIMAESDERIGAFDFGSAHAEAPSDLQQLLDCHESLVRGRSASFASNKALL